MQVVNSNISFDKLEISMDGGKTWQGNMRKEYNYFEKVGGGDFDGDVVEVKITSVDGRGIVIRE